MQETVEMQQPLDVWIGGRSNGKTITLIKLAHREGRTIVCATEGIKQHVLHVAEQLKTTVRAVTFEELAKSVDSSGSKDNKI